MKKSGRIFLDVILPVALYAVAIHVAQYALTFLFTIAYYAKNAGVGIEEATAGLEPFLMESVLLISALSNALVILVVLVDSRIRRARPIEYVGAGKKIGGKIAAASLICGVSLYLWVTVMMSLLPIPQGIMDDYAVQSEAIAQTGVLPIIAVGIIAPVVEEVVFRGLVMKHLSIVLPGYGAIAIQAVLFAVGHGTNVLWISYALVCGLILGYVAWLTGSIRSTVIIHTAFNLVGYLMPLLPLPLVTAALIISPVALILSVWYILKHS